MRRILAAAAAVITALSALAQGQYATNPVSDLGLLYYGASYRLRFTPEEVAPYVVHTFANGKKEWLFDGFLFIDFHDGGTCHFSPASNTGHAATKADWQKYLDDHFTAGRALDGLNSCIAAYRDTIGDPGFKHQIVMTVPVPIPGQKDWGELDGRTLDFDNTADCVAACTWFIDQFRRRFAEAGYENLELNGIYWLDEQMDRNGDVVRALAPVVHDRGLQFVWIPWFKAPHYQDWRGYGFDIAYLQPNYFFHKEMSPSRLDEACQLARQYGMGVEFEADERALSQNEDSYMSRMDDYIKAFKRHKVWDRSAIAYYTGGKLLREFVVNPSRENRRGADRLAREIVKHRKKMHRDERR